MTRPAAERLIGVLIPRPLPRPRPDPAPLALLAARRSSPPCGPLVLEVARLDRSGRISIRRLLRVLTWDGGHRIDVAPHQGGAVLVTSAAAGRHRVTGRGELVLPAAARALVGIDVGDAVVLAADTSGDSLVIYSMRVVATLLAGVHARLGQVGGDR
jgi:bifunctional DNA-binding transcriptional regulator/antitoxin component of YhaV-PrlF toxin-antitoxin module